MVVRIDSRSSALGSGLDIVAKAESPMTRSHDRPVLVFIVVG